VKEISKRDEFGFDFARVLTLITPQIAPGGKSSAIDLFMIILCSNYRISKIIGRFGNPSAKL